jgi:ABC-2 type transport system permease protein
MSGRSPISTVVASILALALSLGLGAGSHLLFAGVPPIYQSPVWMAFTLSLFSFLLSLFWVIWPVVAAQVDEAYELGRYMVYPIRPGRLYLIHSVAGLAEPSVLFFYPALIGAAAGLSTTLRPGLGPTVVLFVSFALMNVAAGRCLQNLLLNLMTSRRSGEMLFGGFLAVLALSVLIPSVDASWLFSRFGDLGRSPAGLRLLENATRSIANTPPGFLVTGLQAASRDEWAAVLVASACMLATAGLAWIVGLLLLERFYRGGRGLSLRRSRRSQTPHHQKEAAGRTGWRLPWASDQTAAAFEKHLKYLTSNPKARLLFAVPFFLLIVLKIISAPALFRYLWGESWAAILLALLGLYVLSVLSGQFFANGFGYDGAGVKQVFLAPAPRRAWQRGRNLAQAVFAAAQYTGLCLLLFLTAKNATTRSFALPLLSFPFGLVVMLAVGNLLSARHPRRYHTTLARRDRPVPASFIWILASLGVCASVVVALVALAATARLPLWLVLAPLPLVGAAVYRLTAPVALRWTRAEKEEIIRAISSQT